MKFEIDNKSPIYLQIIKHIKRKIVIEDLEPGDSVPSRREMALSLNVNLNTVQRAYKEMGEMGIINTYKNYQSNISIDGIKVRGGTKYKNKLYVFMEVYKYMGGNNDSDETLLLGYDLDTNSYKLEELDNYDGYILSYIKLKDNILECVYEEESENIAIKVVKFDMNSKTVLDEFSYVVEEHLSDRSKTYEGRLMSINPNSWVGFTER